MLATFLLVAAFQAGEPAARPTPETDPADIVVIARRLRSLRFATKKDRTTGAMQCLITKTSGDAALDRVACNAALPCSEAANTTAEFKACFFPRVNADAKALYAGRRTARATP